MKKSLLKSSFLLIICLLWIPDILNSQELKLTKKELKEASKTEKVNKYKALGTLLESRRCVFEFDSRSAAEIYEGRLRADRNYIRVDSLTAFCQFEDYVGPKAPLLTWEGSVVSWELDKNDKRLDYELQFKMNTVFENYYIFIDYDSTAKLRIGGKIYLGNIRQL